MIASRFALALGLGLAMATEAVAQDPIGRGSLIIGGNARIVGLQDFGNDQREVGFELQPQFGIFVARGLVITASPHLGWAWRERIGTTFKWGLGPGVTYYVARAGKFYPYLTMRTLALWTEFRPSDDLLDPVSVDDSEWTWLVGLGGSLFIAQHVALNAELFYSRFRVNSDLRSVDGLSEQANSSEQYGLQFGVRVFVF